MATKTTSKKRKAHQNLNERDTLLLWVAAGGRCEMCRKLLTESGTTFSELNLAERAHIVGQGGPTSPRHDSVLSPALATDPDNVMLLCFDCHAEIDDPKTRGRYTVDVLRGLKEAHEERIRYLTSLDAKRTRVVVFQTAIQQSRASDAPAQRTTTLHREDLHETILPDHFPDQKEPSRIRIDLPTAEADSHWAQLQQSVARKWDRLDVDEMEHLSVFCLGKMPAVAYFGQQVGDARKVRTMNVQQGVPTRWRSDDQVSSSFQYVVTRPEEALRAHKDVLLLISLTGMIEEGQYVGAVPAGAAKYQIATAETHRHQDWLIAEKQLKEFKQLYRALLSEIQEKHGQDTTIHLLAAAPTPVVFEIGRQYRPNHHPTLLIYNCVAMKYEAAFPLGGAR